MVAYAHDMNTMGKSVTAVKEVYVDIDNKVKGVDAVIVSHTDKTKSLT